jgi:hypothetical protein
LERAILAALFLRVIPFLLILRQNIIDDEQAYNQIVVVLFCHHGHGGVCGKSLSCGVGGTYRNTYRQYLRCRSR